MQFWPPDDEHICSKHVEAWNKLIVKQKCLCIKLVNYWDKYTEMHGQQNVIAYCSWADKPSRPTRNTLFYLYMSIACVGLILLLSKPLSLAIRAVDSKGSECQEVYSIKLAHDKSCWVTLRTWKLNLETYTGRGMSGPYLCIWRVSPPCSLFIRVQPALYRH